VAATALESLSINYEQIREQTLDLTGRGQQDKPGYLPFSPELKNALRSALRHADVRNNFHIGTGHLLLGLVDNPQNTAAQILSRLCGGTARVQQQVNSLLGMSRGDDTDSAHGWEPEHPAAELTTSNVKPDNGGYSHYAPKNLMQEAASKRQPVVALCGWIWIPRWSAPDSNMQRFPVCPRCKAIFEKLPDNVPNA
jgi:ATP-dependent Clp protease ATP-binding subunit ClpA